MLNQTTAMRLEEYLAEKGFKFSFAEEFNYDRYDFPAYSSYISITLQGVTGILRDKCLNIDENEEREKVYDIDLINKLTSLIYESKDKVLMNIAWNSFFYCKDDERFILHNEMTDTMEKCCKTWPFSSSNHTKDFESIRLIMKPNNCEDSKALHKYIDEEDTVSNAFLYGIDAYNDEHAVLFNVFLKKSNELIGNVGIYCNDWDKNIWWLQYYIKKEYRKNGYAKEACLALLDVIQNNEIVIYGQWDKQYVYSDYSPKMGILKLDCEENNIASQKMAEAIGFEYEGKSIDCRTCWYGYRYTTKMIYFKKIDQVPNIEKEDLR